METKYAQCCFSLRAVDSELCATMQNVLPPEYAVQPLSTCTVTILTIFYVDTTTDRFLLQMFVFLLSIHTHAFFLPDMSSVEINASSYLTCMLMNV